MADIVIDHCTLRVRRRNGWSWGSEPRALLEAAMRALPELLAQRLASRWPDEHELVIDTPLRFRIPISMSELIAGSAIGSDDLPENSPQHLSDLSRRLDNVFKTTIGADQLLASDAKPSDQVPPAEEWPNVIGESGADFVGEPLPLLLKWRQQGLLETLLSSFSTASLEAWHRYLFPAVTVETESEAAISSDETEALVSELALRSSGAVLDRAALLRRRILIAVDAAVKFKLRTITTALARSIDRVLPAAAIATVAGRVPEPDPIGVASGTSPAQIPATLESFDQNLPAAKLRRVRSTSGLVDGEVRISSALPFILLGPLARVGYLEALTATLETAELANQSSLFALALAYKVLEPPERGWRRDQLTIATAAAFAGLNHPLSEPALVEFADQISDHLSPLEGLLRTSLAEGHTLGQPLLLHRTDDGNQLVLIDVEGSFPIAQSRDAEEMLAVLHRLGPNLLLIPQATARFELLRMLDTAEFRFVTDAPPARDEHWRGLRRANLRWWTNDLTSSEKTLLSAARQLSKAQESAAELWQELDVMRPSIPLAADAAFDKHLTFAASVALGTIAWTLWHESEATTPQMALSRFRDFGARVQFVRDAVRVYLPRGRRYQELFDHRLLADISGVPWFGERKVQFAGG